VSLRALSWPVSPSVVTSLRQGGCGVRTTDWPAPGVRRQPPPSRWCDRVSSTTRLACLLVYSNREFRHAILDRLADRSPLRIVRGFDDEAVVRAVAHAESLHERLVASAAIVAGVGFVLSALAGGRAVVAYVGLFALWVAAGSVGRPVWQRRVTRVPVWASVRDTAGRCSFLVATLLVLVFARSRAAFVVVVVLFAFVALVIIAERVVRTDHNRAVEVASIDGPPRHDEFVHLDRAIRSLTGDAVSWAMSARSANVELFASYVPFTPPVEDRRSWTMTVDLGQAEDPMRPVAPIDTAVVVGLVNETLRRLPLRGLDVTAIVLAHVNHTAAVPGLTTTPLGRVVPCLPPAIYTAALNNELDFARPYLRITVAGRDGPPRLVTNARLVVDANTLYLEVLHSPGKWPMWAGLCHDTGGTYRFATASTPSLVFRLGADLLSSVKRRVRGSYTATQRYNAGALYDLLPQSGPPSYFDEADIDAAIEIIDRRVLSAVAEALARANVDTSEFSHRRAQVFNNATIISHNSLVGSGMAVGSSGQVLVTS
jgi:hypothetical protein